MYSDIREHLIRLLEEAQTEVVNFKRKKYEGSFEGYYERHRELFAEMNRLIEESEDSETVIEEIAGILPEYVKEKTGSIGQKRKRESCILDYNMTLVTYVLPAVNYSGMENLERLSDAVVEKWNHDVSQVPIKNSTYEAINHGFEERLCYITTAVCQSLGKPDDCYELELLRNYRDEYLLGKEQGTDIVQQYYNVAPTIVKHINKLADASDVYQDIWTEYLTPCIRLIEADRLDDCREVYSSMVHNLQKKYLYS